MENANVDPQSADKGTDLTRNTADQASKQNKKTIVDQNLVLYGKDGEPIPVGNKKQWDAAKKAAATRVKK